MISRIWRSVCVGGLCKGRLGGWRPGLLCATRVRLIFADPGGRRTMVRRGVPLSMGSSVAQMGWVAHR